MTVLIIAPHPDDETLGAGGTILRHRRDGDDVHWLIATEMKSEYGFRADVIQRRSKEIAAVSAAYDFASTVELGLPATRLDTLPLGDIVGQVGDVVQRIEPHTVYLPFPGDVHSDHRILFEAASACTKSFRYPSIKSIRAMEILSETDFNIDPTRSSFQPNLFIDIGDFIEEKLRIMLLYADEIGEQPFPRSEASIRAQACLRGSQANLHAAEAFMLLREAR